MTGTSPAQKSRNAKEALTGERETESVPGVIPANKAQVATRPRDEIVVEAMRSASEFDTEMLRNLTSFQAALDLAAEVHGDVTSVDQEIGDGFALLDNKDILIGVPLILMEWNFNSGDFGTFVSVRVVARNADGGMSRYIINDGSSGICDQLAEYSKTKGKFGGMFARHGLRRSDYDYTDPQTGDIRPASTYYLDTAA